MIVTEYTLLGLLKQRPRHGYELAREFARGTVLGDIVHLEPSMLYANLKKLEREGFVRSEIEAQGIRPPRKVYAITRAGETAFLDWLANPVTHTRDLRLEFLLKLYFAREFDGTLVGRLVNEQREQCEQFVDKLSTQLESEHDDFHRLVIEMRLAQNRALLDWMTRVASAGATVKP